MIRLVEKLGSSANASLKAGRDKEKTIERMRISMA